MAKKLKEGKPPKRRTPSSDVATVAAPPRAGKLPSARPSSLLDTRVVYCGDNLEQLKKLPDRCVDLIYIDPVVRRSNNPSTPTAPLRKGARCSGARRIGKRDITD